MKATIANAIKPPVIIMDATAHKISGKNQNTILSGNKNKITRNIHPKMVNIVVFIFLIF